MKHIDLCVTKGIPPNFAVAKSCLELSSDHFQLLITLATQSIPREPQPRICNRKTDWDVFRLLLNWKLLLNIPLNTDSDIDAAINNFNDLIQWAGWNSTPENTATHQIKTCPILITQKHLNKRKLRRNWHRLRTLQSKRLLNTATRELKQLLADHNNSNVQSFLLDLSPTASTTNYSLWKEAKKAKQITTSSHAIRTGPGSWARTNKAKAHAFANHLATVFQLHPTTNTPEEEDALTLQLETPYQLEPPLPRFRKSEVKAIIKYLKHSTSPGYDLITGKILQELPPVGVQYLTQIFNASTLIGYFLTQWKVAKIILHLKPVKPPE
jgi:hypothetical protein